MSSVQKMVSENADPQLRANTKVSNKRVSVDSIRHGFYSWLRICTCITSEVWLCRNLTVWVRTVRRRKAFISLLGFLKSPPLPGSAAW